jgi:hypothetical protein
MVLSASVVASSSQEPCRVWSLGLHARGDGEAVVERRPGSVTAVEGSNSMNWSVSLDTTAAGTQLKSTHA